MANQLYTREDAERILARAMQMRENSLSSDELTKEQLIGIAKEVGLQAAEIDRALDAIQQEQKWESVKTDWKQRRKSRFARHALVYAVVNAFLMLMNVTAFGRINWALLPLLGWGLGLAILGANAFFPTEEEVEEGAKRLQKKREKELTKELKAD